MVHQYETKIQGIMHIYDLIIEINTVKIKENMDCKICHTVNILSMNLQKLEIICGHWQ